MPIHLINPSGDEILVHFYCSPGLENNSECKVLLSVAATYAMGLSLTNQPDIVIKNTASRYQAVSDEEFENYNLFKNLNESENLYIGKKRDELDYEYINLQHQSRMMYNFHFTYCHSQTIVTCLLTCFVKGDEVLFFA